MEYNLKKINNGNIYEIKLLNGEYVYVCFIGGYTFGLFDLVSETSIGLNILEKIDFKFYTSCKKNGIIKSNWNYIGTMDLEKNDIKMPDQAIFLAWNIEDSYKNPQIMRNGNLIKVTIKEYKTILKKNGVYGFYDDYKKFENYIYWNLDNIRNNKPIEIEYDIIQKFGAKEYTKYLKLK
jgi:hypothetical protein